MPERENEGKRATEELGELAGVSRKTYEHAATVLDKAPEPIIEATRKKEISINSAYEVTKLPEKQQSEISERIEQGEPAKEVISEVKARKNSENTDTQANDTQNIDTQEKVEKISVEAMDISTTNKKYKIIYVVPTWEGTRKASELCKLPVERVLDNDSALLLWVKASKMIKALKVMKEWGFKYKTIAYIWIKADTNSDNADDWTQENSELCLLATKGNLKRISGEVQQVLTLPVEADEKKPSKFKELTVQLLGNLPALELFAKDNFTFDYDGAEVKWDIAKI